MNEEEFVHYKDLYSIINAIEFMARAARQEGTPMVHDASLLAIRELSQAMIEAMESRHEDVAL